VAEEIAKGWILELVEHARLTELAQLRVPALARHAPGLVADVLAAVEGDEAGIEERLAGASARAAELALALRGPGAIESMPRYLAMLQSLMLARLAAGEDGDGPAARELVQAARRLAVAFGALQAASASALAGGEPLEATGLAGARELEAWLEALVAQYRRYGQPFALLAITALGQEGIASAYGPEARDRMLDAAARVIASQVRSADRAFRAASGEFVVLVPRHGSSAAAPLAERLIDVIRTSQEAREPRLGIAIGVAACPDHGDTAEALLEAAEAAALAAAEGGYEVAPTPAAPA